MKPQVKQSEKSRILSTRDFSMFEFPDVKISKKHLEWVKESIIEKNLLPDYPILVDDGYNILDGKYKFLACYELKIPVHYKVSEVTTLIDAIRIKEICKKTPLNQIIEIYKHIDGYQNLIYLKQTFPELTYKDIIKLIDTSCLLAKASYSYHVEPRINRRVIASGKLPEYSIDVVEKRIVTSRYIVEEFGLSKDEAIHFLVYNNYSIDFPSVAKNLRRAKEIADLQKVEKTRGNHSWLIPYNTVYEYHHLINIHPDLRDLYVEYEMLLNKKDPSIYVEYEDDEGKFIDRVEWPKFVEDKGNPELLKLIG